MSDHNIEISDEAKAELRRLADDNSLTPDSVVARAKDAKSALHSYFEWDDAVAANAARVERARVLIRGVRVVVTVADREINVPQYVRDTREIGQGYVALERLKRSKVQARSLVLYELRRALSYLQRASGIADVLGLDGETRDLIVRLEEIIESVDV